MQAHTQTTTTNPALNFHFDRRPVVLERFGFGNTCLHQKINDGLFPPSLSLGNRSVAWLRHELDQTAAFMVAGKSKDDIRALVSHMVEQRKNAA